MNDSRILRAGRVAVAIAILGATMLTGMTVSGADPVPVTCDAFNGNGISVTPTGGGLYAWSVKGSGVCSGGLPENYSVSFTGSGTSQGNGLCTQDLTSVVLVVVATYSNSSSTFTRTLRWNVPIVIGIEAMPFLVSGDATGVGVASTRLFLRCAGSGGTDAARFVWEQTI
jgi:hypothetical protein